MGWSQPLIESGDEEGGPVADGELVDWRGDRACLLGRLMLHWLPRPEPGDPAGRFGLQIPLFPRPGRVLVGTGHRGVDRDIPGDQRLRVGPGLELFEDPVPGAVPLPSA